MKLLFLILFFAISNTVFANDSTAFSCKYRYSWQKDSTNINSKFDDIMILTIKNNVSIYYSSLSQLGTRKKEKYLSDLEKSPDHNNVVSIGANYEKLAGEFFIKNETEVLQIDYLRKEVHETNRLVTEYYGYTDSLISPVWKIETSTDSILGQQCQMATTTFKGRNYTAWFAPGIPYNMGPWLFNGLPGLILKIADDKNQFQFECLELNTPESTTKVFKAYENIKIIPKKKLQDRIKLFAQSYLSYMQAEGKTLTVTDKNGNPVHVADKPYNPIDLTEK
jgi:GLPGLI family protein